MLFYFINLYLIYWFCLLIGMLVVRSGSRIGKRLEVFSWNSKIKSWQKPPFSYLFKVWEDKKYIRTSLLIIAINFSMVVIQFAGGFLLISPLIALIVGFQVGVILGQGDRKTIFPYGIGVLVFEFGAFASAGGIGMTIGEYWLLSSIPFTEAFQAVAGQILGGYILIPLGCLLANGFIEAAGPIYFNVKGIPGVEAARKQLYK